MTEYCYRTTRNVITSFAFPLSFSICGQIALNASAIRAVPPELSSKDMTRLPVLPTGHMQYTPDTESLPQLDLNLPEAAQKSPSTFFFFIKAESPENGLASVVNEK